MNILSFITVEFLTPPYFKNYVVLKKLLRRLVASLRDLLCAFARVCDTCWTREQFCEAYTGLPVVRATENQKALNCVVLKYSIPVSEEQQIKEKRETLASGLTC